MRSRAKHALVRGLLVALLATHAGLLVGGVLVHFATIDEAAHVPAGLAHWETGRFDLYRVSPPLVDMIAALPAMLARPRTDFPTAPPLPGERGEWGVGIEFARDNADRYLEIIRLARIPAIFWSLLAAGVIYRWAGELYGRRAALLAVALWSFDPLVLAWGQIVSGDVPATAAGVAASYAFWRYLRRPSWGGAVAAGLLLGLAQLTKFTMLVLYVAWPVVWLLRRPWRSSGGHHDGGGPLVLAGQALLMLALSVVLLNAGYGFQGTGRRLGSFDFTSRSLAGDLSDSSSPHASDNRFRGTWLGGVPLPLPEDYVSGIDLQRRDFDGGRDCYLAGRWQHPGWWYYYLYALVVKEPIGALGLVTWAVALALARHPSAARPADEAALYVPAVAILALVSSQTGLNEHVRYVLPAFPFLAVATGKLASFLSRDRLREGAAVLVLLGWSVAGSLSVYPHSMSYFNEAAGGPENGHRHLAGSNVDYGQDLLFLRDWLDRHPDVGELGLAYYNIVDPALFGISYRLPPPGRPRWLAPELGYPHSFGPRSGYFAVSVNLLVGMKGTVPDGEGGTRPIAREDYYEYFRDLRPVARAGYSILIYRIHPDQPAEARPNPTSGGPGDDARRGGPGS